MREADVGNPAEVDAVMAVLDKHYSELEKLADRAAVTATSRPDDRQLSGAVDPRYFLVDDESAYEEMAAQLGSRFDADETQTMMTLFRSTAQRRAATEAEEAKKEQDKDKAEKDKGAGKGGDEAQAVQVGSSSLSVEFERPRMLTETTRTWMAKALLALAGLALAAGVVFVALDDADSDPGNAPTLSIVAAIVAAFGATLVTLGYGKGKLTTDLNKSAKKEEGGSGES